jgi:hypothetical protein
VVSFRTSKPYNLRNFGVRFVPAPEITPLDPRVSAGPPLYSIQDCRLDLALALALALALVLAAAPPMC